MMESTPKASGQGLMERLKRFAARQSAVEIAQQYEVLRQFSIRRRALVTVAFGMGMAYQSVWLTLAFYLADVVLDQGSMALLRGLNPAQQPGRYLFSLVVSALLAATFVAFPALSWLEPDPMAKAYAVGMALIALIHHSTLRNVHLPLSAAASGAAAVIALSINAYYWIGLENWRELVLTTICLLAVLYYAALTITAMHRLQADLLAEREVAGQANLAKTRFVAQLSHELRTPLNAILGMGEAERLMTREQDSRDRMEVLVQSTRGLSQLLDDILDLSAVEAGQLPIRPAPCDLAGQIASTTALFRGQFEDHGMQLEVQLEPSLPCRALLDGHRLRQCLTNILSNAVKYGGRGNVRVRAGLCAAGGIEILVTDEGPGVPPALREQIFEPFMRGNHEVAGTGLGLAIARTLARRMGGDLVLLPDDPKRPGAAFSLWLPFEPLPQDHPTPLPKPPDLDGLRVMVVDDIATNRLVAATYLRLLGVRPIEVASGEAALEIVSTTMPDAILMDLLMPGLDGVQTLQRLQELLGKNRPPVIALSAEAAPLIAGESASLFDGHLVKPLTVEKLRAVLEPVVARHSA